MLISVKINNCFIYENEIEFSMRADMRQKRFFSNVVENQGQNILKSAIILGPNNAGKTNFVRCIDGIKSILLNQGVGLNKNLFTQKEESEFSIDFTESGKEYLFEVRLRLHKLEYLYERFVEIEYDGNKRKEKEIYMRDYLTPRYNCEDETLKQLMTAIARNNLLFYLVDTTQFEVLEKAKRVITAFASKIDIVDMNNIPIKKTIDMMKKTDEEQKKIVDFVLGADLSMEDFKYLSDEEVRINLAEISGEEDVKPQENALNVSASIMEMLHLSSVYHGVPVPSVLFDSTGTKKIASIAGYIIDALSEGRILIVDELDNSLHSNLTRAIIALFNNSKNNCAQLICTAHDISLLDCKKLFRKEQIWFAHKDSKDVYLYSLAEFTAEKDGVRDTTDLIKKYKEGVFGALPDPDLFESIQEVYSIG